MKRHWAAALSILALATSATNAAPVEDVIRLWSSGSKGGQYRQTTSLGTATGAYQLSFAALRSAGYVSGSNLPAYGAGEWQAATWSGKNRAWSRQDFLGVSAAQDDAFASLLNQNWAYIRTRVPIGEAVNGVVMTMNGALAAAFVMGAGGFGQWASCDFQSNCLPAAHAEANNMSLDEYQSRLMKLLADAGEVPSVYLMQSAPASGKRAAPMMPGTLKKLGPF